MSDTFNIVASWDIEASVWVATSDDVIGLVAEAPTVEKLLEKLKILIPELLELNHSILEEKRSQISMLLSRVISMQELQIA